jgi:hypothetical protein
MKLIFYTCSLKRLETLFFKFEFQKENRKGMFLHNNWQCNFIFDNVLVNRRLCPNLRCIWVQNRLWGLEISKINLSYRKLWESCMQMWIMYGLALLKLSIFLWQAYGQKYDVISICNFLTKFGYYCSYYVVIWRKNFELSLEDRLIFHLSLETGLEWDIWAKL